jgi:uncharacterized protein (TIGR03435 family)
MIAALTNHLWQSTLFVLAAGVVAFALRKNGAHIRHRVWVVASLKFLVPFSVLMSLGSALPHLRTSTATAAPGALAAPALSLAVDRLAQPFTDDVFFAPTSATTQAVTNWTAIIIVSTWTIGFLAVAFMRLRGWRRIRAAVQASAPLPLVAAGLQPRGTYGGLPVPRAVEGKPAAYECLQVRSSPGFLEPGVVGWWKPVLLVPAGIEHHLTPSQLEAVLAHELCHVQRRDNLTSAIHMVVEAAFWFHPLVWWVGARLVDERERACDEHVLRVCGEPRIYAESILNVCKLYVESPIACVSGVSGADLKKRVAAIMVNRIGLQLNFARKVALALIATLAIGLPLVAGMVTAPLRASAFAARAASADSAAQNAASKFDVASVKPCDPDAPPPSGRSGGAGQASPGYLNLSCMTLRQLVSRAYLYNQADHLRNRQWGEQFVPGFSPFIRGGPSWVTSERFTIEAKAEGVTDQDTLTGPMLRALLEDRFQVKTHRATEERSMYALTVVKTGLKIQPTAPGSCYEGDPRKPAPPHDKDVGPCGYWSGDGWGSSKAYGVMLGDSGRDGQRFVDHLWGLLLQPVVDRTGLEGRYSFALEFTPDDSTPGVRGRCGGDPGCMASLAASGISDVRPTTFKSSATIFTALEELGLKLEQTKGPAEYLVIDSAEHPRPNGPVEDAMPPARVKGAGR